MANKTGELGDVVFIDGFIQVPEIAARWNVASTKNAATDTTANSATGPSLDGYNSVSATSILMSTVGSEDLHFASYGAMAAIGAGADLSGTFTTDIDGQTRAGWFTGADWLPSTDQPRHGLRLGLRLGL